ncbi:MAG: hypothetical protein IKD09_03485 [Lentisphaeria bacterium]|nr:hypothetical protein [Lentisphaeria bacterium]
MGSLRCLGDLGASVSKIFRPDRQNGFISATEAKLHQRHAERDGCPAKNPVYEPSGSHFVAPKERHLP